MTTEPDGVPVNFGTGLGTDSGSALAAVVSVDEHCLSFAAAESSCHCAVELGHRAAMRNRRVEIKTSGHVESE
jgi:hypothetical protein